MIARRERGFIFTPIVAFAILLLLLSTSYLTFMGRESGYIVRAEYIKPVVNQAVLAMTHQKLSRAAYLGVVDFINGVNLPKGGTNGYRNGYVAVHAGGSNIEWVTPEGLAAPYRLVDVGSLDGSYDSYKTVIESLRYYIDYELARLAVDIHDKIKRNTNAEVWIIPRCYVTGEPALLLDLKTWRIYLPRYIPSDPSSVGSMPIVPSSDDPSTLYVRVQLTLIVQAPRWELIYMDLGQTTVTVSVQGYAPVVAWEHRPILDPLPIWAYYAAKARWGDNPPLRFKPQLVPGNYQIAVGNAGTLAGEPIKQSDAIRFFHAYLNWVNGEGRNSTYDADKLRLAHMLSVPAKSLPWDDVSMPPDVRPEDPPWVIQPYFPVRWNDETGRPPNFVERAAGILYVLPDGNTLSVDGIKSGFDAVWRCRVGMETLIPALPSQYVTVLPGGPHGTVDWMAWMEALCTRSPGLRGAMYRWVSHKATDQWYHPVHLFWLYGFNSGDRTVQRIVSVLRSIGIKVATDAEPKGFALPGVSLLNWFILPGTNTSMVEKNGHVIKVWPRA